MSATRSDTDDTTDYDQASPRTVAGDAGTAEGGSLSASRLLRSVGRIVGLGSPQGVPSATNLSRHHTGLPRAAPTRSMLIGLLKTMSASRMTTHFSVGGLSLSQWTMDAGLLYGA